MILKRHKASAPGAGDSVMIVEAGDGDLVLCLPPMPEIWAQIYERVQTRNSHVISLQIAVFIKAECVVTICTHHVFYRPAAHM